MKEPVVVIGIGEMAGVFTRGILRQGHPVFPVTRQTDMEKLANAIAAPALVLVTVGENDLHPLLERIPVTWRNRLGLLQNELLPRDWQVHGIQSPTVIAVWFEKKRGQDYKVLVPSPIFGPQAPLLEEALEGLEIPAWELANEDALLFELIRKNVYILTTNIAGLDLPAGTTVDTLWNEHQPLARQIAEEVMDIQFWLTGRALEREQLIAGMVEGIEGDRTHQCMGRSAPGRLARAIGYADEAKLAVPTLRRIYQSIIGTSRPD